MIWIMAGIQFFLLFAGGYFLLTSLTGNVPSPGEKTIRALFRKEHSGKGKLLSSVFGKMTEFLSARIRLDENRKAKLASDLAAAGKNITPEEYLAEAAVIPLLFSLLSVPCFFFFAPGGILILILAVFLYRRQSEGPVKEVRMRREKIESELPLFCEYLKRRVKQDRNVVDMLDEYIPMAGKELGEELTRTVGDMRSSNVRMALLRLETRVGSLPLGELCRGLAASDRGEEDGAFWEAALRKAKEEERRKMKAVSDKVPGKIKKLSFALMCCFFLMYGVVFYTILESSLGGLF